MNNTQNIQAWEALILTVKTGNVSQTALLMGLDISKVSRLIAGLEEELGYPLVINLADEYAVKYLNLPEDKYLVEEQVDSRDYLYNGDAMRSLAGSFLSK